MRDDERERFQRDRFEALYAELLSIRPEYLRPDDWMTEWARGEREEELARLLTTTPSVFPWMMLYKMEVLEHYLGGCEDGTSWTDNRELVMLAGIKADLLRFGMRS